MVARFRKVVRVKLTLLVIIASARGVMPAPANSDLYDGFLNFEKILKLEGNAFASFWAEEGI